VKPPVGLRVSASTIDCVLIATTRAARLTVSEHGLWPTFMVKRSPTCGSTMPRLRETPLGTAVPERYAARAAAKRPLNRERYRSFSRIP
jgi:hypothetical protein